MDTINASVGKKRHEQKHDASNELRINNKSPTLSLTKTVHERLPDSVYVDDLSDHPKEVHHFCKIARSRSAPLLPDLDLLRLKNINNNNNRSKAHSDHLGVPNISAYHPNSYNEIKHFCHHENHHRSCENLRSPSNENCSRSNENIHRSHEKIHRSNDNLHRSKENIDRSQEKIHRSYLNSSRSNEDLCNSRK